MLIVDKFAPQSLDDIIILPEIKTVLDEMIKNPIDKLKNMTLAGLPGIGKTALAKAIVKQTGAECLFLNASKENNVDVIRYKVSDFCGCVSIVDQIKIVVLDEADCLSVGKSGAAGAQEVLRGLIEQHQDDCRFILTCNYINRIIPALISRCPIINIQFTPELIKERLFKIVQEEGIKIKKKDFEKFFETVVKAQFPKIRNIFHAFDTCLDSENVFHLDYMNAFKSDDDELEAFCNKLLEVLDTEKPGKALEKTRQLYLDNSQVFGGDYVLLGNALFKKMYDFPMAQISMADYIFKMQSVADPEVQFYSMLVDIKNS